MPTDRSNPGAAGAQPAGGGDGDGTGGDESTTIDIVAAGELVTVIARGDIDAVAAPALRGALAEVIERGPTTVRIDMAAVDFLDSVGISVLVASFNQATDAGVGFELMSVPPSSRRVLEITRLTDVLTILD
jgi:anti-anti-sigma factor